MKSFNREFLNLKSFSGYNLAKGEKVKINVIKPILNKQIIILNLRFI